MKVKVKISKEIEVEVNDKIFNDLYEIHRSDPRAVANDDQYYEAEEVIARITGIPITPGFGKEKLNTEYIYAVYAAEDDEPILET